MLGFRLFLALVVALATDRQDAVFHRYVYVVFVNLGQRCLDQVVLPGLADIDAWAPFQLLAQFGILAAERCASQGVVVTIEEAFHVPERRPVHNVHVASSTNLDTPPVSIPGVVNVWSVGSI